MPRTRDLVALSAILLAPLAALLLAQPSAPAPEAVTLAPVPPAAPLVTPTPTPAAPVVVPALTPTPLPAAEPVVPEPPAPAIVRDPGQAMLVYKNALVLRTAADPAWASGRFSTLAEPGYLRATRPAHWDRLPEPVRALEAARVVVYDSDGSSCVATIGAPRLHLERSGEIFPDSQDDEGYSSSWEPPTDKAALRTLVQETYKNADDLLLLTDPRGADGRPCHGEWARRADLPTPAVFGRRTVADDDTALARAALPVIREQPEFAALRAEYLEYADGMSDAGRDDWPDWDAFVATNLSTIRWDEVGGPRRIVSVELRRTPEPCSGEFGGSFALLLEQHGDQFVRLAQPAWFDLTALMDTDRDGILEAVTRSDHDRHALEAEGPNATAISDSFWISYVGCPC